MQQINAIFEIFSRAGSKVLNYLTLISFFRITYKSKSLRNNKKSELWNHLSYRGLPYPFEVGRQTFRNAMIPNFQVTTSKFKIEHPLTSMASKTALPNIIKMVSNCHIFSKDWYDVYAVRGLWSWSKYFFQTCVLHGAHKWLNELISIRRTQMSLCKTELLC